MKQIRLFQIVQGPIVAVAVGIGLNLAFAGSSLAIEGEHTVNLPVSDGLAGFFGQFTLPDFGSISNSNVWVVAATMAIVASLETLLCVEATAQRSPRPGNDTKKYAEKTVKRPPDHKQSGTAGNRDRFWFLKIYPANCLSRHEARCVSKPACKGNLSCQSYLYFASGFAATDYHDNSTQLSNKLKGTKAHKPNDCPNTCEHD